LEEYKHKTDIQDSAMNGIAPYLRNIASILLFAERTISDLEMMDAPEEHLAVIKEGYKLLLQRAETEKLSLPLFHETKSKLAKIKKPEQYFDFCNTLFRWKA
jgi:hypothetical protein